MAVGGLGPGRQGARLGVGSRRPGQITVATPEPEGAESVGFDKTSTSSSSTSPPAWWCTRQRRSRGPRGGLLRYPWKGWGRPAAGVSSNVSTGTLLLSCGGHARRPLGDDASAGDQPGLPRPGPRMPGSPTGTIDAPIGPDPANPPEPFTRREACPHTTGCSTASRSGLQPPRGEVGDREDPPDAPHLSAIGHPSSRNTLYGARRHRRASSYTPPACPSPIPSRGAPRVEPLPEDLALGASVQFRSQSDTVTG